MHAFVMVRKGSERIPNKNIKPFANTNLLQNKISTLKNCKKVDKILVSSNCEESLEIARENGCILDKRPDQLCSSKSKPNELYKYMAEVLTNSFFHSVSNSQFLLSASVCYPLLKPKTYDRMIQYFEDNYNGETSINYVSSFAGCHSVKENLWERKYILSQGVYDLQKDHKALNYVPGEQPASQDLPDIISIVFGSIITSVKTLTEGDLIGSFPEFYDLPHYECLDIDEVEDFEVAEILYKYLKGE